MTGRNRMGKLLATAALIGVAVPAFAQSASPKGAIVQTVPASAALDRALMRLAGNPRDVSALLDAGGAALDLDDTDAATGFYSRAAELVPTDPRAKAGLGAAMVRSENPYDALLMFEEAEKLGAPAALMAGDRGLAWDLVGNFTLAQAFYRQVLGRTFDAEVTRRLAISLAISGDVNEARRALKPLLDRRDPAASRAHAFVLAIAGDAKGAEAIALATMPQDRATRIIPYLRYMPRLTAAQQAAAANFGHFPRTADIGQDDPRVAKYNRGGSPKKTADAGLIPSGEPLGRKLSKREQRDKDRRDAAEAQAREKAAALAAQKQQRPAVAATAVPPVPRPSLAVASPVPAAPAGGQSVLASVAASQASAELPPVRSAATTTTPSAELPPVAGTGNPAGAPQIASFDLAGAEGSHVAAPVKPPVPEVPVPATPSAPSPAPMPAPAPQPQPAPPRSVADAFADFAIAPVAAPAPQDGAVDITRIKPRLEEPPKPKDEPVAPAQAKGSKSEKVEKPAKPAKPVHRSRNWVQVGTGRDKAALAFDWRRMTKAQPELFKGKQGYFAAWGQTNRMVTGPFDSAKAAQQFVASLKGKGIDSFTFTSAEGEEVTQLPAGK